MTPKTKHSISFNALRHPGDISRRSYKSRVLLESRVHPQSRPLSFQMMASSSFIIPTLRKYFSSVGGRSQLLASFSSLSPPSSTHKRKHSSQISNNNLASSQSWSEEWESLGLGARLPKPGSRLTNLMFVQMGFGVDQHGNDGSSGSGGGATKAACRAVRNAIEFNSIPGIIEAGTSFHQY